MDTLRYSNERRPGRKRKNTVAPAPEPGPRAAWRDVEGFACTSEGPGSGAGATQQGHRRYSQTVSEEKTK